jgi:hypothetical protein
MARDADAGNAPRQRPYPTTATAPFTRTVIGRALRRVMGEIATARGGPDLPPEPPARHTVRAHAKAKVVSFGAVRCGAVRW